MMGVYLGFDIKLPLAEKRKIILQVTLATRCSRVRPLFSENRCVKASPDTQECIYMSGQIAAQVCCKQRVRKVRG